MSAVGIAAKWDLTSFNRRVSCTEGDSIKWYIQSVNCQCVRGGGPAEMEIALEVEDITRVVLVSEKLVLRWMYLMTYELDDCRGCDEAPVAYTDCGSSSPELCTISDHNTPRLLQNMLRRVNPISTKP